MPTWEGRPSGCTVGGMEANAITLIGPISGLLFSVVFLAWAIRRRNPLD
jgi:hypothetical protein